MNNEKLEAGLASDLNRELGTLVIMKRAIFFTMVSLQDGKWTRVGSAYNSRKQAQSWLSFVKNFWGGRSVKVSQFTVKIENGQVCEKSKLLLLQKYNLDA